MIIPEKIIKVVIAEGEYAETYAPFQGSKELNDEKIKRGILTHLGMKQEEIDKVIDSIEVEIDKGGADGRFDDGPYTPVKLTRNLNIGAIIPPPPPPPPKTGEDLTEIVKMPPRRGNNSAETGEIPPRTGEDSAEIDKTPPRTGEDSTEIGEIPPRTGEDSTKIGKTPHLTGEASTETGKNPPHIDPELDQEIEKDDGNENEYKPRQTMLDQYYGDRKSEARRTKIFDRFKSHITKKIIDTYDEDGNKRNIEVYTIEDYEEKAQDADELLLDGYQTRLERLSRAHQRDFSPYKREFERLKRDAKVEIMLKYQEMHSLNAEGIEEFQAEAKKIISEIDSPEFERDVIQALIDQDTEFVETNNYTYNSHQHIAEILKTMGKHGEKSVKAPISDEQNFVQKLSLNVMNTLITLRNTIKVPINKAIGTYVASPIYRALMGVTQAKSKEPINVDGYLITPMEDILATSQKHSRGMYRNKPFHRYHVRKDYFIAQEREKNKQKLETEGNESTELEENDGKKKEPKVTLWGLIKLAIVPRIKAIVNYKEGNVAVLNAGLYDIEQAAVEREEQVSHKMESMDKYMGLIAAYEKEIIELEALAKVTKNPEEKEKIEDAIKQAKACRNKYEGLLIETERTEIDSISTSAVSLSEAYKSDKAVATMVIRDFKRVGRIATGVYLSKYLYDYVLEERDFPPLKIWIPPQEIEKEIKELITELVPGMDIKDIGNITLGEIYSHPRGNGLLSYYANALGDKIEDKTSFFRGLAFNYNGKLFSGSDGKGLDPTFFTDVQIDQTLDENTTLTSIIQEILNDKLGSQITEDQVNKLLANGDISGISIWRSGETFGTAKEWGWFDAQDIVPDIINSGSHEITKEITKTITEIIPGRCEVYPGGSHYEWARKMNPVVSAAELGLVFSEIADQNEILRHTRSEEDKHMRSTKKLMGMARENRDNSEEKGEKKIGIRGTRDKDVPELKIRRKIKSIQRSNKSKHRAYTHVGGKMKKISEMKAEKGKKVTVFEGLTGTKKADKNSGFDENLLGINDKSDRITNTEDERS